MHDEKEERQSSLVSVESQPNTLAGLDLGPSVSPQKIGDKIRSLLERQLELGGDATLEEVEKLRSERAGLLEILSSLAEFKHLGEILQNSQYQFKRKDEIDILQSQLDAYRNMSSSAIHKTAFIEAKLSQLYVEHSESSEEIIRLRGEEVYSAIDEHKQTAVKLGLEQNILYYQDQLEQAYSTLRKSTSGLSELIKTERLSGNRGWANDTSSGSSRQVMVGIGGGGGKKNTGGSNGHGSGNGRTGPRTLDLDTLSKLESIPEIEDYKG